MHHALVKFDIEAGDYSFDSMRIVTVPEGETTKEAVHEYFSEFNSAIVITDKTGYYASENEDYQLSITSITNLDDAETEMLRRLGVMG